jgi:hypothetical protein
MAAMPGVTAERGSWCRKSDRRYCQSRQRNRSCPFEGIDHDRISLSLRRSRLSGQPIVKAFVHLPRSQASHSNLKRREVFAARPQDDRDLGRISTLVLAPGLRQRRGVGRGVGVNFKSECVGWRRGDLQNFQRGNRRSGPADPERDIRRSARPLALTDSLLQYLRAQQPPAAPGLRSKRVARGAFFHAWRGRLTRNRC